MLLRIVANKPIEKVDGFELDEYRTTLSKTVSVNEENTIILEDISGNRKKVYYSISNIDKVPPQIIGIEDGKIYNKSMSIKYKDNVGIKDIKADKYTNNLFVRCLNDYYDTTYYKGLDILGNQITVNVTEHPKGTKYYKYYLNNELKATTEEQVHVFTGLTVATTYTYKVEAVNENDEVIKSVTNTVKTKCFKTLNAERVGDNFKVKITGIDSRVNAGFCALWHENSNQKFTYPTINSDRSIDLSFNAYEVDGIKSTGHYYFHLQLYNYSDSNFNEIICMNIMFFDNNSAVGDPEKIDPNNLNKNGNYEITVIDLAGNKTTKCCTIQI